MIQDTLRLLVALVLALAVPGSTPGQNPDEPETTNKADQPSAPETDQQHYQAGLKLLGSLKYEEAIDEFKRAISINPKKAIYYNNVGFCLTRLQKYDEAAEVLKQALSVDPKNVYAHRELGYVFYRSRNYDDAIAALDELLKIKPDDFSANYWRGVSLLRSNRPEEASQSLSKAVELRPNDFYANFFKGASLTRLRKFNEAIPSFERASALRPNDNPAKLELFICYLITAQTQKAVALYPVIVRVAGGIFVLLYLFWFALLLPFSLPVRNKTFPGIWFSLAWLALFFEGQIAFMILLSALPWLRLGETVLAGCCVAGLPILAVALFGFTRQTWGAPFRWPLRFGKPAVILTSVGFLVATAAVGSGFAWIYVHVTHKPFPLQNTVPLIENALRASPAIAWLAIALIIPIVEEILFRGLLFGAFEHYWGPIGAIVSSSVLFALVHLQLIGFLQLLCIGLTLGWARLRSGSIGLPIGLHVLNNTIALFLIPHLVGR